MKVTDTDSPYYGMKINNGVVFDDQSVPVAYFVLEESLQFSLALKGQYIPVGNMQVMYKPDWCDQGRGVTAFAHAIRRIFDTDDTIGYMLIGIKRDSVLPIIRSSAKGSLDKGNAFIKGGVSDGGTPITLVEGQGGEYWDVTVDSKSDIKIPVSDRPSQNTLEFIEHVLIGVYQGLEWPYEYTRMSKEARGANIRVTVEKINRAVRKQYNLLHKIAVRKVGYALGTAVERGELPHGEWWELDFPMPPEMTADKYHEYQEDRENYKIGLNTIQDVAAKRGLHWQDDIRKNRDEDMDDLMTRVESLQKKHPDFTVREVMDMYQQRSANPGMREGLESDPSSEEEAAGDDKPDNQEQKKKKVTK